MCEVEFSLVDKAVKRVANDMRRFNLGEPPPNLYAKLQREKEALHMKRRPIRLALGATVAAIALALTACTGGSTPTSTSGPTDAQSTSAGTESATAARGENLALGGLIAPSTLLPQESLWGNHAPYFQAVYDTLTRLTADGEIEPMLADSWQYNDELTELTLKLRDDVTFTDGSTLDSGVVKANLDAYLASEAPQLNLLGDVTDVAAPDEQTVVITLGSPNPALLNALAVSPGIIVSEAALGSDSLATTPVGSGPYVLDSAASVLGSSYVYTRNPDYWDEDLQHYENLHINVYPDSTSMLNAILSGAVNGALLQDHAAVGQVEAAGWTAYPSDTDVTGLVLLDRAGTMNPALGDVRVRQAINLALDRPGLLQAIADGHGTATTQVFPERSIGFDAALDERYPYDVEQARKLMQEAGYGNGFTLRIPSSTRTPASVYNIIATLMSDIGVTMEYEEIASGMFGQIFAGNFAAAYISSEQGTDWAVIQNFISPDASLNPFDYSTPQVDALIERVRNGDESAVGELNKLIVEEAWFAPMFREVSFFVGDANTHIVPSQVSVFPSLYDFSPK